MLCGVPELGKIRLQVKRLDAHVNGDGLMCGKPVEKHAESGQNGFLLCLAHQPEIQGVNRDNRFVLPVTFLLPL